MAFPVLLAVVGDGLTLAVGVPVVWLLSRAFRLRPKPIMIMEPRKEAGRASIVIIPLLAWRASLVTFFYSTGIYYQLPNLSAELGLLLLWAALNGGSLLIVAAAMKTTRQTLASIGINRSYMWNVVALGLTTSAIYVAITGLLFDLGFTTSYYLSHNLAIGLGLYSIVGFSEETVWRGYVQTRFVAYAGVLRGVIGTSLIFGILYHFPTAYYLESSQMVLQALAYASLRVFWGLLFGYLMVKSQNILASSIFHGLSDWTNVLWH